jgi:hypothetical protein
MTTDNDAPDELDKLAAGRVLISKREVALALDCSPETAEEMVKRRQLPRWVQTVDGGPKKQFVRVIRAFLEKRRRVGYVPPTKRGALLRGRRLEQQGGE